MFDRMHHVVYTTSMPQSKNLTRSECTSRASLRVRDHVLGTTTARRACERFSSRRAKKVETAAASMVFNFYILTTRHTTQPLYHTITQQLNLVYSCVSSLDRRQLTA